MNSKLESMVVYHSMMSDRLYMWDGEKVLTRLIMEEYWKQANGWPNTEMSKGDLEYYINKGDFVEIEK